MTNEEEKTEAMNRETPDLEDIFRDFFTFADFDPDADDGCYEGNLLGHRYDLWELCRTITKIVRDYNSEALAFVMLRAGAENYFASERWSIRDFAENRCTQEMHPMNGGAFYIVHTMCHMNRIAKITKKASITGSGMQ